MGGHIMSMIGNILATSLSGEASTHSIWVERSYDVIPQVAQEFRSNPRSLNQIYINTQHRKFSAIIDFQPRWNRSSIPIH